MMQTYHNATIDGEPVALDVVRVDDLHWGHREVNDRSVLSVSLSEEDLRRIGRAAVALRDEMLAEDPEYFDDDSEPVPSSEEIFVEHPEELRRYLGNSLVWSRRMAMALFDVLVPRPSDPEFYFVSLRAVRPGDRSAVLELGGARVS